MEMVLFLFHSNSGSVWRVFYFSVYETNFVEAALVDLRVPRFMKKVNDLM